MAVALSTLRVEASIDAGGYVSGANQVVDSNKRMVDSADKVAASQTETERRLTSSGSAAERLARSIDPAYQAQRRLEAGTATLQRAFDSGNLTTERHSELLQKLTERYGPVAAGTIALANATSGLQTAAGVAGAELEKFATSHRRVGNEAAKSREALVLVHEFISGRYKNAISSSLIELQNFGAAETLVAYAANPLVLGLGLVAGVTALVGLHLLSVNENIKSFNILLSTVASGSGQTARGLQDIVRELQHIGVASTDAKSALDRIISTPGINQAAAGQIAKLGFDIGAVTGNKAEPDALARALAGGAESTIKYAFALNSLSAPEAAAIRDLAEHGRLTEALQIAADRLSATFSGRFVESQTEVSKALTGAKNAYTDTLDAISKSSAFDFAVRQFTEFAKDLKELVDSLSHVIDLAKSLKGPSATDFESLFPTSGPGSGVPPGPSSARSAQQDLTQALRDRGWTTQEIGALTGGGTPAAGGALDRTIRALIQRESGGNASVVSSAGAIGLTQLLPDTARELGVNPFDPAQNVAGGTQYLLQQTQRFGNLQAGLQAYNWGPGNYQRYLQGNAQLPQSVQQYSSNILANAGVSGQTTAAQLAGGTPLTVPTPEQTAAVNDFAEANRKRLEVEKEFAAQASITAARQQAEADVVKLGLRDKEADAYFTEAQRAARARLGAEVDKTTKLAEMESAGALRVADAYKQSEAAGLRQVEVERARVDVLTTGGNADKLAEERLRSRASAAIQVGEQQLRSNDLQLQSAQRLAEASAQGEAAVKEAEIQNQVAIQTANAKNLADASGNQILKDKAAALNAEAAAQVRAIAAARETTAVNERATTLRDQTAVIRLEASLQGQTSEEIQKQVELLRLKQDFEGRFKDASSDAKNNLLAQTTAIADATIKLGEERLNADRINGAIRGAADTVNSTLTTAIDDAFSGQKITDWGTRIRQTLASIASQLTDALFIKPLIGSVAGALGAAPSITQQFGLLGGSSASGGGIGNVFSGLGGLGKLIGLGGGGTTAIADASGEVAGAAVGGITDAAGEIASVGGGLLSSLGGIGSVISSIAPLLGPIAGIGGLIAGAFGNTKPSNNAGGLLVDLSSGQISGAQGNAANLGVAQQIGTALSAFERDILTKTGAGTLPGGSLNVVKGDLTGITTSYSGPLGDIKGSFASAQDAINQIETQIVQHISGLTDTLTKTLSRITDPSQIQAAIDFAKAYDSVNIAYDNLFTTISVDSVRKIGPFETVLNKVNDQFSALTKSAEQYGLSLDPINQGYRSAKDRLASDFNQTIAQALAQLQDPTQAAIEAEKKAGEARVQDAQAVGADLAAVDAYNAANLKKMVDAQAQAIADADAKTAKAAADAAKAVNDFVTAIGPSFESVFSSLEAGAGPFERALIAVNDNFAKLTEQAAAAGAATDGIADVAQSSRARLTRDFDINVQSLTAAITDPVGTAIAVERQAGEQRVRDATAVAGDLAAVSAYNAAHLKQVTDAAQRSVTTLASAQEIATGAADTLSAAISSLTGPQIGQYAAALKNLQATLIATVQAAVTAGGGGANLQPIIDAGAAATQQLREAFNRSIQAATLGLTDPFQAALNVEIAAGRQRVAEAQAVGGDIQAVDELNRRSLLSVAQAAMTTVDALATAAGYNRDVAQQILQITDPVQAALNAELDAGQKRIDAAQKVGADLAKVDELNRLKLIEVANATQQSTAALDAFTGRLQTLEAALGQLVSGPLAGLTPGQTVKAASANFERELSLVRGGNLDEIGNLSAAGTSAVQASQAAYGNAKQTADLRAHIVQELERVAAETGRSATLAAGEVAITAANQAQVKTALAAQATATRKIADYAQSQADMERQRAGAGTEQLQGQADAARQISAGLDSQAASQSRLGETDAARAQLAAALLQQEAAVAARTAQQNAGSTPVAVAVNIGTPEQQAQYLAATQVQAAEVASRTPGISGGTVPELDDWITNFVKIPSGSQTSARKALAAIARGQVLPVSEAELGFSVDALRQYAGFAPATFNGLNLSDALSKEGYARGTGSTIPGWIRVGEQGPEWLFSKQGGDTVLPHGIQPPPAANDDVVVELRQLREEFAALRKQTQGGQVQAARDARMVGGAVDNVGRKIMTAPQPRRTVA